MDKKIEGKVFCLGNHIDTDQIIPAKHLVYKTNDPEERKLYGKFALSGLPVGHDYPFVEKNETKSPYRIILAGKNFGCGSSREHAPFALKEAGIQIVIAQSYARIFYRNSVDGGFFPPMETLTPVDINQSFKTGDEVLVDLEQPFLENKRTGEKVELKNLGFIQEIIEAGDLFSYAQKKGLTNEK
jgi:3-isopropylmalate/(R)-2-methylmalate dehydratase small subunit